MGYDIMSACFVRKNLLNGIEKIVILSYLQIINFFLTKAM